MKKRNIIFDHLRALSMLGVVAIHVGDLVMQSGTPWNWLYLLCEVLSRYSVPTFFFISGYGLFYSHPLEKPLEYRSFIKKRFKSIGIPYVVTSLFYMGVASLMARNLAMWHPKYVLWTGKLSHLFSRHPHVVLSALSPMEKPHEKDGSHGPLSEPIHPVYLRAFLIPGQCPLLGLSPMGCRYAPSV